MSDFVVPQGATSVTLYTKLTNSVTGSAATGLTSASGGLQLSYVLSNATAVPFTPSPLHDSSSVYSAGAFFELSQASCAGLYRIDPPDSAFTNGQNFVIVNVSATNVNPESLFVTLDPNPAELSGTVQSSATNSTTQFLTNLASTTTSQYVNSFVLFRTGANAGAQAKITAYAGSTPAKLMTTAAFPSAGTTGDLFVIINR